MKKIHIISIVATLLIGAFAMNRPLSVPQTVAEVPRDEQNVQRDQLSRADIYGQIPLSFEANQGQVDASVQYLSRGAGYNLFLTPSGAVLSLPVRADGESRKDEFKDPHLISWLSSPEAPSSAAAVHTLQMTLDGATTTPRVKAHEELASKSNYFVGNDSRKWRTGIPNYSRVEYEQVYEGVDLVYYGNQRQLEYDFKVAAGADPKQIKMKFAGADKIELNAAGDLLLHTAAGEVRMRAPVTYQEIDGVKHEINSSYALSESADRNQTVSFEVAAYDTTKPLVIDPVLLYSTYLGGSGNDDANSVTVDSVGNAYMIGFTDSTNFPVAGAVQATYGGNPQDVFVSKLNAAGTGIIYSTYLGGSGQDNGSDIAVDAAGNAYITGYTGSTNFPTASAMQATRTGIYNAFVAKLNPAGSQLVYSTYFGGTVGEFGSAIAVDSTGSVYVGGVTSSTTFPDTPGAIQANYGGSLADAFVAKFNPAGSQVVYATYLGGNGNDGVTGIAIDSAGNAHVTGVTFSSNFPTASPLQANFRGGAFDAFISKLNPTGTALIYSTYMGGTEEDRGFRIALDNANNVYVGGQTLSANFPVVAAIQPTFGGGSDGFVMKLNAAGAVLYATYLGGSGLDGVTGLDVTTAGAPYVTGFTTSTNFPSVNPLQVANNGGAFDAFLTKVNAAGTAFEYSTYLGGTGYDTGFDVDVDSAGSAYLFGRTDSTNFQTRNPFQSANAGGFDLFMTRITDSAGVGGLEGDLAPRPTGNGLYLTNDLAVIRQFFAGEPIDPTSNEFQRADCAPFATRGDGNLSAADVQQVTNYIAVLNPPQAAGGPLTRNAMPPPVEPESAGKRGLRVVSSDARRGNKVTVSVEFDASGDETAASFTLNFDPAVLSNPVVELGRKVQEGTTLTVNATKVADGRLGVLLDSPQPFAPAKGGIITITFDVAANAPAGSTPLTFDDSIIGRGISDALARSLTTSYRAGDVIIR